MDETSRCSPGSGEMRERRRLGGDNELVEAWSLEPDREWPPACTRRQSAVARLEARAADVRVSTLERYAAALGWQIG